MSDHNEDWSALEASLSESIGVPVTVTDALSSKALIGDFSGLFDTEEDS